MSQEPYFLEKPEQIKISLTNICNYRCVMCYNPRLKQERGLIDGELMGRILDDCCATGVKQVALGATGEPLLHPGYLKFLERAKALGLRVSTTSNCSKLTEETTDQMLELGLDRLNISLYSSDPVEHRKYTGTDTYEEVEKNVRYFIRRWRACGKPVHVNMWFLQLPGINSYERYLKRWKSLCDESGIALPLKEPINWAGSVEQPGRNAAPRWALDRVPGHLRLRYHKQVRCGHVRYYLHVLHSGDVLPCCNVPEVPRESPLWFGNLKEDTILGVWNGDKYRKFKEQHFRKNIAGLPACRTCSDVFRVFAFHMPPMKYFGANRESSAKGGHEGRR